MDLAIRPMTIGDYDAVAQIWTDTSGVGLSSADSRDGVRCYLRRNKGLSLLATAGGELVGAVLAGHGGRRGFLNHLVVARTHRRRGIGTALVHAALEALRSAGIQKCHLAVIEGNREARLFYEAIGWTERHDLRVMSRPL